MLKELILLLRLLKSQDDINVVLFTSSGPDFCTGLDLHSLIDDDLSKRLDAANHLTEILK